MEFIRVIERKKMGFALIDEEIACFAQASVDPATPDYQLSALLMAIRLNGMDARETAELTLAMARTGDMLSPDVGGVMVDKHSTGGVGDTTTLILVPLVAACGGKVLKMSGRGLGHTGGTIDKMESIAGLRTTLSQEEMLDIVRRVGCVVAGQSARHSIHSRQSVARSWSLLLFPWKPEPFSADDRAHSPFCHPYAVAHPPPRLAGICYRLGHCGPDQSSRWQ